MHGQQYIKKKDLKFSPLIPFGSSGIYLLANWKKIFREGGGGVEIGGV